MKKAEWSRPLDYIAPAILLIVGIGAFVALSNMREAPASTDTELLAPLVETVRVVESDDQFELEIDGEVNPFREIVIAAEVAGRVIEKPDVAYGGNYVHVNTVLFKIDPRDYQLEIDRLTEQCNQVDVDLDELAVEVEYTDRLVELSEEDEKVRLAELERDIKLVEQRAGSQRDVDRSRREVLVSQTALRRLQKERQLLDVKKVRLQSEKRRLAAELDKAELSLERAVIKAPIDGVIVEDLVEKNGYVSRGTALFRMEDTSKVEVRFHLQMDELRWLWHSADATDGAASSPLGVAKPAGGSFRLPQIPVEVMYDIDGQEFVWSGQLSRYDGAGINAATRTVPCIAVVDRPQSARISSEDDRLQATAPPTLMRDMFVTVKMKVGQNVPMLHIPESAIRPGNRVWLYRDGLLQSQRVRVAHLVDGEAFVLVGTSPLKVGDQVIVSPLASAVDGMKVRLHTESPVQTPTSADSPATNNEGSQP